MSLVSDLLERTTVGLAGTAGAARLEVDQEWARHEGKMGEQAAGICGWAWKAAAIDRFRVAILEAGERVAVFSAFATPNPRFDLPLFGAEVIMISGTVTVVALDWIPLFPQTPHLARLAAIRERFSSFPPGGELPAWAADSFSPFALFSRPRGAVADSEILAAFSEYLLGYLDLATRAKPHGDPTATLRAQRHYCTEHLANDPGAPMLGKLFGEEWAQRYAHAFLFPLPQLLDGATDPAG